MARRIVRRDLASLLAKVARVNKATWRRRLLWAFGISLALHAVFAWLYPANLTMAEPNTEFFSLCTPHILRITRLERPRVPVHPHRIVPQRGLPHQELAVIAPHATPRPVTGNRSPATRPPSSAPSPQPTPRATAAPIAAVTTAPSAQPVAVAAVGQETVVDRGFLPLDVIQAHPVLDEKTLRQLVALGVHVKLIVDVSDAGHTLAISFIPPLDAATQLRITTLLETADWDPSFCGAGIPCAGRATIVL